jgi:hypothetical protein
MQVDTASSRALNEEIINLNAQLAKHKELQGDAGAMHRGKRYLRLVDGGDR